MTNDAASAVTGTLADLGVDPSGVDVDDVTEGELRHLQKQEHLKKKSSLFDRKWGGVIGDQVHLYSHTTHWLTHWLTHSLTHSYLLLLISLRDM